VWCALEQLGIEETHPIDLLVDRAERFLKHDPPLQLASAVALPR
jgi:hypothetical protein